MMSNKTEDGWVEVARERCENKADADTLRTTKFSLSKRGKRWAVEAVVQAGELKKTTAGRGDSPREACDIIRGDIGEWAKSAGRHFSEYETILRRLCYQAEDDEYRSSKDAPDDTTFTTLRTVRRVDVRYVTPLGSSVGRWVSIIRFSDGSEEYEKSLMGLVIADGAKAAVERLVLKHGGWFQPGGIIVNSPTSATWTLDQETKKECHPLAIERAHITMRGGARGNWYCVSYNDGQVDCGEWNEPISTPLCEGLPKAVVGLVVARSPTIDFMRHPIEDIEVVGNSAIWTAPKPRRS